MAAQIYEVVGLAAGMQPDYYYTLAQTSSTAVNNNNGFVVSNPQCFGIFIVGGGGSATTVSFASASTSLSNLISNDSGSVNPTTPAGLYTFACGSCVFPADFNTAALIVANMGASVTNSLAMMIFRPSIPPSPGTVAIAGQGTTNSAVNQIPVCILGGGQTTDTATVLGVIGTSGNIPAALVGTAQFATTGAISSNVFAAVRTPNIFKTAQFSASGLTPVWTPVSGKKFRLMRFAISIPDNATTSGGGVVTVSLFDAGTITSSTFTTFSITSNVLTINGTFSGFAAGQNIILTGFTTTYLNNITITLTTASGSVLTAAFNHSNVSSTSDTTGTAIAGIITAVDVYLPSSSISAPIGDGFQTGWVDLGNGYISTTANNPLAINLSAAIATANARISVCGTEE